MAPPSDEHRELTGTASVEQHQGALTDFGEGPSRPSGPTRVVTRGDRCLAALTLLRLETAEPPENGLGRPGHATA
ncbi:hypothetical protein GCM10010272_46360 [Streptomyces lateritius]|nr:hypothetical protein GCM10010272_46360 [Streptomyces lateritius]